MKEQNQRRIQNQSELDERRLRQKKLVRKRKIVLSVMLLTSFLLGCVCGRYFPEIKLGKTEEVLASAQDNSDEEKKENQITNDVDNGTTADGTASDATSSDGSSYDGSSYDSSSYGDDGSSNGYFADGTPVGTDDPDYDTNQTRTIYRNSDGYPLVIYPNGDGSWCDDDGNTYTFSTDEDVYDENGGDYYYGGEPAYVRYMPKN